MRLINESTADLVILGGDLNDTPPNNSNDPLYLVYQTMKNAGESFIDDNAYATYGNSHNSYTYDDAPEILDYIFYKRY